MFSFLCRPKVLFIRTFVSSRCEFGPVSESSHFLRSHGQRTELDHTLLRVRKWAAFENGVINELPIYGNFTIYKREYPRKWTSYGQKENILVNLKKLGSQSAKITLCVFFLTTIKVNGHCQRVHTEVIEREATKLCNVFGCRPVLKVHFQNLWVPSPKTRSLRTAFARMSSDWNVLATNGKRFKLKIVPVPYILPKSDELWPTNG